MRTITRLQLTLLAVAFSAVTDGQSQTAPQVVPPNSVQERSVTRSATPTSLDTVVLSVGSEKFTRAQFEQILALAENGGSSSREAKRAIAEELSRVIALAQEARRRKLDQSTASKQMIMIQAETVLANALRRQVSAELAPDDAAMHAFYDAHKSQLEQAKTRHILIRFKGSQTQLRPNEKDLTEEEALAKAQAIEKKLDAGESFEAIAKAESDDPETGAKGGVLGPFGRGQMNMVPEFEKVAFSQAVGKVSEPVKTKYGYFIIKVEERTPKAFEEVKPEIENQIKTELTREAIERLKKEAAIEMNEAYFGK